MAANDRCELCQPVAVRNRDKQNVKLLIPVQMTSSHGGVLGRVNIIYLNVIFFLKKGQGINRVYWLYFTSLFVFVPWFGFFLL